MAASVGCCSLKRLRIETSFSKRETVYEPVGLWGFRSGLSPIKVPSGLPDSCLPASQDACESSVLFRGTEIGFQLFSHFLVTSGLKRYFCSIS